MHKVQQLIVHIVSYCKCTVLVNLPLVNQVPYNDVIAHFQLPTIIGSSAFILFLATSHISETWYPQLDIAA